MSPLEVSVAERFAVAVRGEFPGRVRELKVFGSRARGEARADSDLDIFVLLDQAGEAERARITDLSTDLMLELALPFEVSPRIFSQPQFDCLRDLERLLPNEIDRDGISL